MKNELMRAASAAKKVVPQPERMAPPIAALAALQGQTAPPAGALSKPLPKVPSLLLEGDPAPPPAPAAGPGEKAPAALVPSNAPQGATPGELPAAYGTKTLLLAAREPHGLYAHWDLTTDQQNGFNSQAANRRLVLRVGPECPNASPIQEVPLDANARHRFVEVPLAGTRYAAELGYYEPGGQWLTIAFSNTVTTPPESAAEDKTVRFATLAAETAAPLTSSAIAVPSPAPDGTSLPSSAAPRIHSSPLPAPESSLTPAPGRPPLDGSSPPASPPQGGYQPPLEPSLLPAPTSSETPAARAWEMNPLTGNETVALPGLGLAEAGSDARHEWTPAKERALAALTAVWTRRGEANSAELVKLLESAQMSWAAQSIRPEELGPCEAPENQAPVQTPGASSPQGVQAAAPPQFWLKVNAEVVIYGATEPGARLVFAGQPLQLRPDGTFSCRLALPDGNFEVVLSAASSQTDDRREAKLKLSRRTEHCGAVGEQGGNPPLPAPPSPAP